MIAKASPIDDSLLNCQPASVFIATTQGLVQVQSIIHLPNSNLQSVATINGTSELAGVSGAYASFVSQPQGIIQQAFGGDVYRINFSSRIDQGDSWQLGVFIAHYLHANNLLLSNSALNVSSRSQPHESQLHTTNSIDSDNKQDVIFIATGKIDTIHHAVLEIQALDKKCMKASAHIQQWISQNKRICFIAPTGNFRRAISNSVIKLTPIRELSEIRDLLSVFGLDLPEIHYQHSTLAPSDFLAHKLNVEVDKRELPPLTNAIMIENSQVEHVSIKQNQSSNVSAKRANSVVSSGKIKNAWWIIAIIACLLLIASIVLISSLFNKNETSQSYRAKSAFPYAMLVAKSTSSNQCKTTSISIASKGIMTRFTKADTVSLANTCQLTIVTPSNIKAIWLVSDTKAIIPLQSIKANENEQTALDNATDNIVDSVSGENDSAVSWHIPLPSNQSQTRKYKLILFENQTDRADVQSLDSFLLKLNKQGRQHSFADLSDWATRTQIENRFYIISQSLTLLSD